MISPFFPPKLQEIHNTLTLRLQIGSEDDLAMAPINSP